MRHWLALSMALALLPAGEASSAPAATDRQETKRAKELFSAAQKLYQQRRYSEAIEKFEEAYVAKPHPVVYFNIGRCHEELGQAGPALKAYKSYLRLSPEAKDRNQVADTIAGLERKLRDQGLQQLTVVTDPVGAQVEIDGKPAGVSPVTLELSFGNHRLVAMLDGHQRIDRSISLAPGQASELNLSLVKGSEFKAPGDTPLAHGASSEPRPLEPGIAAPPMVTVSDTPSASAPRKRVWTYVVGGVAIAGLGAGVGLGVASEANAAAVRNGDNGQPRPADEVQRLSDASKGLAMGANVSYGVAAAAAITAVVLFFVER